MFRTAAMPARVRAAALALAGAVFAVSPMAAWCKTLVYCSEGSPENFTPALNTTATSHDAERPLYDKLTQFARGSTRVEPGLAESWTVSPDGKTLEFHLRKGVKFHSGVNGFKPTRDFDADDVLFSFDRQWKPDHPYAKVGGGKFDYFADMGLPKLLKAITKVDPYTVRFELNYPDTTLLADLAMPFGSIHSAEYADFLARQGHMEQFDQLPVGTGPFQFVSYQKDAVIRFKRNADYWGEKAKVDSLVYAITPDATARYAKLKAGECHFMIAPRPADLPEMQKDPALKVVSAPGLNIAFWSFNTQKPPFDKKEVRIAFAMAIDKAAILRDVYQGTGTPAKNMIPPTMWSYDDKIQDWPYDPARAKAMLAAAGVKTPLDIDLWYMPVQRPYNPNAKRIAEMMQSDLAKVGIDAKLVTYEWGEYRKRLQQGEHMTGQSGWTGDNGDPDNFFFLLGCDAARPGGQNISKWCDKEFDSRLVKAKSLTDQAARTKLYMEMQQIAHDEEPQFNIAHSTVFEAMRAEVVGYKQSPFGGHEFQGVDLAK